jgi:uncharacterized protein YjbI with pentapeptide repeats
MRQIRFWWRKKTPVVRVMIVLALGASVLLLIALLAGASFAQLCLVLGAGLLGALITVAALQAAGGIGQTRSQEIPREAVIEVQAVPPTTALLRAELIVQLGSGDNHVARRATVELRRRNWLNDDTLQGAFLHEANLQAAELEHANLKGAFLFGANLQEAQLDRANLQGANLYEARLQNARLSGARLHNANLFRADLRRATLTHAGLNGATMGGTDLTGADLTGANLQGAILGGANLHRAVLVGTDLRRANLEGANLLDVDLLDAVFDVNTILPDGTRWEPSSNVRRFTVCGGQESAEV